MALGAMRLKGGYGDRELPAGVVDEFDQRRTRPRSPIVTEKLRGEVVVTEDASIMRIALGERRTRRLMDTFANESIVSGNR